MKSIEDNKTEPSYLITCSNRIVEVSRAFTVLTGYTFSDLTGKTITEVFRILRINSNGEFEDAKMEYDCYLFTKAYEPREINLSYEAFNYNNEKIYFFYEKNDSHLNDNLAYQNQFIENDVVGTAFFSAPDLILLKANSIYLDILEFPYNKKENSIGRKLEEILTGFEENGVGEFWSEIQSKGKAAHIQEASFLHVNRGMTYWDLTVVPIKAEGKIKYFILNITDVTQNVVNRKLIEEQAKIITEQNKQLNAILDSTNDIFSIFDNEGRFVKQNKKSRELFSSRNVKDITDFYNMAEVYDPQGQRVGIDDVPTFKVKNGHAVNARRLMFRMNGVERYFDVSGRPIFDEDGNFLMGVISSHDVTDHVVNNKTIELQKKQLEAIIESIDEFLSLIDKDGRYIRISKIAREQFNMPDNSAMGDFYNKMKFYDLDGNEIPLEEMATAKIARGEKIKHKKMKMKAGDQTFYYDVSGVPVLDEAGNFFMGAIITYNITEIISKNRLIEEQNKQMEAILENMSDALHIVNKNGDYIKLNNAAKAMYPFNNIKRVGDEYSRMEFFDRDDNRLKLEQMPVVRMLSGEKINNELMFVKLDDIEAYVSVSAAPVFDETGNISLGIMCSRDVTETINYGNTIKTQRDMLYKILDTLDIPILRLSYPAFEIIEVNKMGLQFINRLSDEIGLGKEVVSGKRIQEIFPRFMSGEHYKCICDMAQNRNSVQLKDVKIPLDNKVFYMNLIYQPILEPDGEIKEFLIILNDVTYEVLKRQEIEKLMKMQEDFFSFITHEFRTPLTTINSAIQVMDLIYKDEMTQNIKKNINMIRRNTYQQLRLVNSLLDITRAEAGYLKAHKKNFDIVAMTGVIAESVSSFAKTKGVQIKFSSSLREKVIAVDDEKYERILLNLLSNAIKFTPEGKRILMSINSKEDTVYIKVKDEGIGIPKEMQDVIFDRFGQVGNTLTRQSEGTGIGLCLVKLLVKAMDGDIFVESNEGGGAEFTFTLPDRKALEGEEVSLPEITDNRLIRSINMEFSNIYL